MLSFAGVAWLCRGTICVQVGTNLRTANDTGEEVLRDNDKVLRDNNKDFRDNNKDLRDNNKGNNRASVSKISTTTTTRTTPLVEMKKIHLPLNNIQATFILIPFPTKVKNQVIESLALTRVASRQSVAHYSSSVITRSRDWYVFISSLDSI